MVKKAGSSEYFVGKQYHIGCSRGDLAPVILLVGDPARAEKIAKLFSKINFQVESREYVTYTGEYQNMPLSVMSTGIGADNTDIAVVEIAQCLDKATLIRVGSCGAIQDQIEIGDLVISSGAISHENTSSHYEGSVEKPQSDLDVLAALKKAAEELNIRHFVGTTCTASSFYAGQGREVPGFPVRDKEIIRRLSKQGVLSLEMETSLLFNLANHVAKPKGRLRAGAVCAVYSSRTRRIGFDEQMIQKGEQNCIKVALLAAKFLSRGD
ncbi:MAG: nucleoside phosphorylase [Planctomycetes bacterium]|nr:nucleoside phosphorylase [Planctomycetota bacterium]